MVNLVYDLVRPIMYLLAQFFISIYISIYRDYITIFTLRKQSFKFFQIKLFMGHFDNFQESPKSVTIRDPSNDRTIKLIICLLNPMCELKILKID